jgi:hypothetical protein
MFAQMQRLCCFTDGEMMGLLHQGKMVLTPPSQPQQALPNTRKKSPLITAGSHPTIAMIIFTSLIESE